jgi:hypothetical protein
MKRALAYVALLLGTALGEASWPGSGTTVPSPAVTTSTVRSCRLMRSATTYYADRSPGDPRIHGGICLLS